MYSIGIIIFQYKYSNTGEVAHEVLNSVTFLYDFLKFYIEALFFLRRVADRVHQMPSSREQA